MDPRLKPGRWHRRRNRRARRMILLLLPIIVVAIAVVFGRGHTHHISQTLEIPLPVSMHHTTSWLRSGADWTPTQAAQLRTELDKLAATDVFPPSSGMLVVDGRNGRVLYSRNSRLPLIPGSAIKLMTAAAAFGALGPEYRFVTSLVSDENPSGGVLNGNIWFVGGGDPELTSDNLRSAVREIQLHGVQSIAGNIYADGSRYGPDRVSDSWEEDDLQYGWAAPASAVSIDGGSLQFTITPRAGTEATVAVDPPGQNVIASVETAGAGAENTLHIDPLPNEGGYEVRGQIPYGAPQKYWRAVPHPTRAAAVSLLAMLKLAGIEVSGSAGESTMPAHSTTLWEHRSRTLDRIIKQMFFLSDNHYAEELLRAVGWKAFGLGDLQNSFAAEQAFLQSNHMPSGGVVIADGSGLSARNRVTANSIAASLQFLLNQPLPEPPFTLLPRAGIEGTVRVRHLAPGAKGRVFAKDGYIQGASALAGYVLTMNHGPVIFVFLVNNWEHGLDAVWANEDSMLDLIASR
jgi:serine-type D-Ala-D-Ala carboxypeptidase/endopeptidase (penicillin-binding protein 4)